MEARLDFTLQPPSSRKWMNADEVAVVDAAELLDTLQEVPVPPGASRDPH